MKLLLIGDERKMLRMHAWGFAADSFRAKIANTKVDVVAALDVDGFQLACIDLRMQENDALDIVRVVHERVPDLPILALVGERERKQAANLRELGIRGHLLSPFSIESLHALIRSHVLAEPVRAGRKMAEAPAPVILPSAAFAPSRASQILGVVESFLETICRQLGKPVPDFSVDTRRLLEGYAWPGNLRELRNVVERAAILSTGSVLEVSDFPALITQAPTSRYQVGGAISLQALENAHIQMVVANSSSLEEAARILEIDKSTLYRKRKLMEARVATFRPALEAAAVAMSS